MKTAPGMPALCALLVALPLALPLYGAERWSMSVEQPAGIAEVVDGDDVRVLERGEGACLIDADGRIDMLVNSAGICPAIAASCSSIGRCHKARAWRKFNVGCWCCS